MRRHDRLFACSSVRPSCPRCPGRAAGTQRGPQASPPGLTGPLGEISLRLAAACALPCSQGPSPSWHLDYVEVVERAVGKSVWFPCKRWLSSDLEDGMTQRTLAATDRNPEEAVEDYKVEVVTSNIRGAGTDSNIWLVIHGVAGSSSRKGLRGPLEAFGRGCHDTFVLKRLQVGRCVAECDSSCEIGSLHAAPQDLGTLQRIEIGHDGSGSSPAWHLDHVTITPKKTGKPVKFLCRKWFGKGVGDGKAERELLPEGHQVAPELCTWEVVVYTANVRGAGIGALRPDPPCVGDNLAQGELWR